MKFLLQNNVFPALNLSILEPLLFIEFLRPFSIDELPEAKLLCVSTPTKGRGMASLFDLSPSSLVHKEEPYAAVQISLFSV